MIIEFRTKNFLSFKDLTTLSMVAAKPFKEHQSTHLIETGPIFNLLKSAIIYGNNASGKSNLLRAIRFMRSAVLNSFREALEDNDAKREPLEKFALNTKTETEASFFEISFIDNETKYRYGFEIDYNRVVAEWLFHTTGKEVYLFKREFQKIEINKSAFKEGIGKEEDVKENVLFLSVLATNGKEISSRVVSWFKRINFVNGIQDYAHKFYTINKLISDKQFFNWVLHFIKYLEIANLSTEEIDDSNLFSSAPKIQQKPFKRYEIVSYHRKYNEDNILVDTVPFLFYRQESEGTKKLLYLLGPLYDTLINGKILIVDELDSRLHSHLTLFLISHFHQYNKKSSQLICAANDISLLNNETFRRDQIWFLEKDQFGASELFSLADFKTDKVRKKSAFDKNYLDGKYGAIPYFSIDEQFNKLLYGEEEATV